MAAKLRHHFEGCRKQNREEEPVLRCIPVAGAWPRNWPVFIRPSHADRCLELAVRAIVHELGVIAEVGIGWDDEKK